MATLVLCATRPADSSSTADRERTKKALLRTPDGNSGVHDIHFNTCWVHARPSACWLSSVSFRLMRARRRPAPARTRRLSRRMAMEWPLALHCRAGAIVAYAAAPQGAAARWQYFEIKFSQAYLTRLLYSDSCSARSFPCLVASLVWYAAKQGCTANRNRRCHQHGVVHRPEARRAPRSGNNLL